MTHMKEMSDSEGDFGLPQKSSRKCRSCNSPNVSVRTWESSDGGYEDYNYTCQDCGYDWWIDGIDS